MVLIYSNEQDGSTSTVCEWVHYLGGKFVRLNGEDFLAAKNNFLYELNNEKESSTFQYLPAVAIDSKNIKSVWHRRNGTPPEFIELIKEIKESFKESEDNTANILKHNLQDEFEVIAEAHKAVYDNKKRLGNAAGDMDKFEGLKKAKAAGLLIPASILTGQKQDLLKFNEQYPHIITKAAKNGLTMVVDGRFNCQYTEELDKDTIDALPENFFPSLFQEKLDKSVELRIFYLNGVCYSMAIFSQLDDQTSVDFRKYNHTKANRSVPYNLPKDIEEKIDRFMKSVNLNTGSLDIIKTTDKRYVFLEVNAVGQFGMVSSPCNYYLEKKVAEFLVAS